MKRSRRRWARERKAIVSLNRANPSANESEDKFVVSQINRLTPLWRSFFLHRGGTGYERAACSTISTLHVRAPLHRVKLHPEADWYAPCNWTNEFFTVEYVKETTKRCVSTLRFNATQRRRLFFFSLSFTDANDLRFLFTCLFTLFFLFEFFLKFVLTYVKITKVDEKIARNNFNPRGSESINRFSNLLDATWRTRVHFLSNCDVTIQ